LKSDIKKPYSEQKGDLPSEIYKAVVTAGGKLTPQCEYIMELRKTNEKR
jgi:hypothetical protein